MAIATDLLDQVLQPFNLEVREKGRARPLRVRHVGPSALGKGTCSWPLPPTC
jgi:hypothetical protein